MRLFVFLVLVLLSLAARAGYREGLEELSRGHFDEAYAELKASAEAGDVSSQRYLGWLLERGMDFHGRELKARPEEAAKWYRMAAEAGDRHSSQMMGVLYESGRGVPQDTAEALRWFAKTMDVQKRLAALAKFPESDRADIAAWTFAIFVIMSRETDRGPRDRGAPVGGYGTIELLFDAGTAKVSIVKSDARASLDSVALKWGRTAMAGAAPTPGAVRNAVKFPFTVDIH